MNVIENATIPVEIPNELLYGNKVTDNMYARVQIPKHMSGRVLYLDCDCLLLQSVEEMNTMQLGDKPLAAVPRKMLGWHGGPSGHGLATGVLLFDCDNWNKLRLTKKCWQQLSANNKKTAYKGNVEKLLSEVIQDNYVVWPSEFQNLAYYGNLTQDDKILHIATRCPWKVDEDIPYVGNAGNRTDKKMPLNYVNLWEAYYNNDIEKAKELQAKLPTERTHEPIKGSSPRKYVQLY